MKRYSCIFWCIFANYKKVCLLCEVLYLLAIAQVARLLLEVCKSLLMACEPDWPGLRQVEAAVVSSVWPWTLLVSSCHLHSSSSPIATHRERCHHIATSLMVCHLAFFSLFCDVHVTGDCVRCFYEFLLCLSSRLCSLFLPYYCKCLQNCQQSVRYCSVRLVLKVNVQQIW